MHAQYVDMSGIVVCSCISQHKRVSFYYFYRAALCRLSGTGEAYVEHTGHANNTTQSSYNEILEKKGLQTT